MFEAFVLACSMSSSMVVDQEKCIIANDTQGPYESREECHERAVQMTGEVLNGILTPYTFFILGEPPLIYAEGICKPVEIVATS